MPRKTKCRAGESGFTLVELMITLAILAILGLLTIPAYNLLIPRYRAAGAAKALTAEFQLARMRAMSKNVSHTVSVDAAGNAIRVYENDPGGDILISTYTFGNTPPVTPTGPHFGGIAIARNPGLDPVPDSLSANTTDPVTFTVPGSGTIESDVTFLPNGASNRGGEVFFTPTQDVGTTENGRSFAVQVHRAGLVQKYRWKFNNDPNVNKTTWTPD